MLGKFITYEEFVTTKTFLKNGTVSYGSPLELLGWFYDLVNDYVKTMNWSIDFKTQIDKVVGNENEDETKNLSYARAVLIGTIYSDSLPKTAGFTNSIGILYSLDTGKPILKLFAGVHADACTNLAVFNASFIKTYDIGVKGSLEDAKVQTNSLLISLPEIFEETYNKIKILQNFQISTRKLLYEVIGRLTFMCCESSRIGLRTINYAMEEIVNPDSVYNIDLSHLREGNSNFEKIPAGDSKGNVILKKYSLYDLYASFTSYVTEKSSLSDVPDKILEIGQMFLNLVGKVITNDLPTNPEPKQ